ncbi:hypothetical protein RN2511_036100 [Rhodococcus sp. NKCM2511]|nr:hypothetical protein RN2511_036100 [Rhodococcus sp. NKCM2511]
MTHELRVTLALYGLHAGLPLDESFRLFDVMLQEDTGKVYQLERFTRELVV